MPRTPRGEPAPDQLEPGETVLALARCSPPDAWRKQSPQPMRIAVTDRRLLALKTSQLTGRSQGDVERAIPLRDVVAVHTKKRHPVSNFGVPVFAVSVVLSNGDVLVFETSGYPIWALGRCAEALETAAPNVPGSMYESDVEAADET